MFSFIRSNYETVISIAVALVTFIIGFINSRKAQQSARFSQILNQVAEICAQIECLFPNGCGDIKRNFVLKQVERLCNAARVPFNKLEVTDQIEKVLSAPQKK